jgi:N-methylhydantoinase B/oxoprolinase/acetone carboxylase alpha subunit
VVNFLGMLRRSKEREYPYRKSLWEVKSDDVMVYLCGEEGYGDPLERDPELVLKDMQQESYYGIR